MRIQVVEPCGEFFRKATGVDEHEGGVVFQHFVKHAAFDGRPYRPPVETREVCSFPPPEVSPLRSANASMAGLTPEICVVWRFGSFTAPALRPASSETGSRMAESGSTTFRSMSGCDSGLMTRTGRMPPRKRAASAGGSTVAESPMRWTDRPARLSNRSKLSARCAPRLSPRWRALHPR